MYEYTIAGGLPAGSRGVWSNRPLQPLAQGILTPLSYSTLADVMGRAWYKYFDALDFDPMPKARIMRQVNGLPYLSLTLSAQRDAEQAAIEPITLQINGQAFPVSKWEKPGFLAALKFGMKERKVQPLLDKLEREIGNSATRLAEWYERVREYRWTQADILLVMEEIEPLGSEPMMAYFAARHNLDLTLNRILRVINAKNNPNTPALIEAALGSTQHPLLLTSEKHRCPNEGELRNPRWDENPGTNPAVPTEHLGAGDEQALLNCINGSQRKAAQEWLQQARKLLALQNKALAAFSYILAGTRRWALAAERESMADKRVAAVGDIFFYELEEVKQMMTGEWNISDAKEIQATAQKRKAEYTRWQEIAPVELLIGDSPAQAVTRQGDKVTG
ncbi:MAG: hypothetical protein U0175_11800 [Caldilineaceae bacterium]